MNNDDWSVVRSKPSRGKKNANVKSKKVVAQNQTEKLRLIRQQFDDFQNIDDAIKTSKSRALLQTVLKHIIPLYTSHFLKNAFSALLDHLDLTMSDVYIRSVHPVAMESETPLQWIPLIVKELLKIGSNNTIANNNNKCIVPDWHNTLVSCYTGLTPTTTENTDNTHGNDGLDSIDRFNELSNDDNSLPRVYPPQYTCFGLGSINSMRLAPVQFAFMLLSSFLLGVEASSLSLYDPQFEPIDIYMLQQMGCTVLDNTDGCIPRNQSSNNQNRYHIVYLPHVPPAISSNSLISVWDDLPHIILLSNTISDVLDNTPLKIPTPSASSSSSSLTNLLSLSALYSQSKAFQYGIHNYFNIVKSHPIYTNTDNTDTLHYNNTIIQSQSPIIPLALLSPFIYETPLSTVYEDGFYFNDMAIHSFFSKLESAQKTSKNSNIDSPDSSICVYELFKQSFPQRLLFIPSNPTTSELLSRNLTNTTFPIE